MMYENGVMMRYTGANRGHITLRGVDRQRAYRVARGWQGSVHTDDVSRMLALGKFEVVVEQVVPQADQPTSLKAADPPNDDVVPPNDDTAPPQGPQEPYEQHILTIEHLQKVVGFGDEVAEGLKAAFGTIDAIREASDEALLAVEGVGKATLAKIREALA